LPEHAWFWDGTSHVDPQKEARAQGLRLKNNVTNLAIEYSTQGKDWEVEIRQRSREKKLMRELGLTDDDVNLSNK
jgi:capsid protein